MEVKKALTICWLRFKNGGKLTKEEHMMIEFFIQMKLPTVTHQQKKVHVVNGKPHYYEPDALKDARQKFSAHLAAYVPEKADRSDKAFD